MTVKCNFCGMKFDDPYKATNDAITHCKTEHQKKISISVVENGI